MTQTVTEGRAAATGTLVDAPDTPVAPSMSATERVPRTGRRVWERAVAWRWTPLALLGLLSAGSLGSRVAYLGEPSGRLIGDEPYYVNAARVILGQAPGADSGFTSATAGIDPVVAHPPLVKVLIAASIRVFGDNPLGWRFPSILFGSIALLAMYWLVRGAGGGRWLALGCASVMALDSLFVVYGRTGNLDIVALVFLLAGVGLYLRGRLLAAGAALAVGMTAKLTAIDGLLVVALLEVLRPAAWRRDGWRAELAAGVRRVATCSAGAATVFIALLLILDRAVTGFDNPLSHVGTMVQMLGGVHGLPDNASHPWDWLLDNRTFSAAAVLQLSPNPGGPLPVMHPIVYFLVTISPAIILVALPAFAVAASELRGGADRTASLAVAWCLGTYVPYLALDLVLHRTSYIYYMLIVMPGVYLAVARLFTRRHLPPAAIVAYAGILIWAFVSLYPIRTWSAH